MKYSVLLWIVLLILSCHTSPRSYGAMQANPVDSLRLLRMAVMGAIAMWMLVPLFVKNQLSILFEPPIRYVFIYGMLGLMSTFYSPSKSLTAWKSIEILVDVGLAAVIVHHIRSSSKPGRFLAINHLALGILVLVLESEALLLPGRGYVTYGARGFDIMGKQLRGIFPSMNASMLGYICAVASGMSLASLLCRIGNRERVLYAFLFMI